MIDEIYNPKAFILIKGKKDMKKKIEYIKNQKIFQLNCLNKT